MGSWVHKVYGALGSFDFWGLGFTMFAGCWAHKFFGALGLYNLWGRGFIKFMGP